MRKHCGWHGTVGDFLNIEREELLNSLNQFLEECMGDCADSSQLAAWKNSYAALQDQFIHVLIQIPEAKEWGIVFEYELPRERGRRPDVVILPGGNDVIILEFKGYPYVDQADIDQVAAYGRDLGEYHSSSHGKSIDVALVLNGWANEPKKSGNVIVLSPGQLNRYLATFVPKDFMIANVEEWVTSEYAPLPSIVSAARTIFSNEELPQIRRAQSVGINDAVQKLSSIVQEAELKRERQLVLVTGVPGAGKTLLGLQFVYDDHLGKGEDQTKAIFLSGNVPLVKVLQHALQNKVFVRDIHGFLKEHGGGEGSVPPEHIFVYDEAQRAWDAERVREKRKHEFSEPEDFIHIGDSKDHWAVMVGLIGEGQEIHLGEESGIGQWADAVNGSSNDWKITGPERLHRYFKNLPFESSDHLDLNKSLRSHLASDLHLWVHFLLEGKLVAAKKVSKSIHNQDYTLYVTRDLEVAKEYVKRRYQGELDKRYGWIGSSKAKILDDYGIHTGWNYSKRFREGAWYNDPIDSEQSCCQFGDAATEFSCQGLELDFPLIGWGADLIWKDNAWCMESSRRSKAKDPYALRVNSYRVLLTRGRDGMIVFIPPEDFLDETFEALLAAGAKELKRRFLN